jgi:hypothetical protein
MASTGAAVLHSALKKRFAVQSTIRSASRIFSSLFPDRKLK